MSNRMSFASGALTAMLVGASLLAPGAARAQTMVPAGTAVPLRFENQVSTKTAHKGDRIALRVREDVVVNGETLIKQDAPAEGVVETVKKPGIFGKRGKLKIRLVTVNDVNGRAVPLEPYSSGERFSAGGPGAAAGGLLVLGPIGLVGGAFVHGSNVTIGRGTRIEAKVAGSK